MTQVTLFVCSLCRFSLEEKSRDGVSGGEYFIEQLQAEMVHRNLQDTVHIKSVQCMAACSHPCNVMLAAPGKLTFVFSGLPPAKSAKILSEFCQKYTSCPDGRVPYRERSPAIHQVTAFILPPLPPVL